MIPVTNDPERLAMIIDFACYGKVVKGMMDDDADKSTLVACRPHYD